MAAFLPDQVLDGGGELAQLGAVVGVHLVQGDEDPGPVRQAPIEKQAITSLKSSAGGSRAAGGETSGVSPPLPSSEGRVNYQAPPGVHLANGIAILPARTPQNPTPDQAVACGCWSTPSGC